MAKADEHCVRTIIVPLQQKRKYAYKQERPHKI
jgi:hypothetical protein